jgi:hypothetical protein
MKIAKIINDQIFVDEHKIMFPLVAFPPEGNIPQPFMEFHNLYDVVDYIQHDAKKQKIQTISPKLIDNKVYIVEVVDKSKEEIDAELLVEVRSKRDKLLLESDLYVMSDRWDKYTQNKKDMWSEYRQKLRDVPQDFSQYLDNVFWPTPPLN